MARECEAMAQYAVSNGLTVPVEVLELLDGALSMMDSWGTDRQTPNDPKKAGCLPGTASPIGALARTHAALAAIIAPATPEGVLLIADERTKHPRWSVLGPVPVARHMLILALVSLLILLVVSLSQYVNAENVSKSLLELSGYPLLLVEVFLLSAASLGSCFANLQRINAFLSEGNFNPKYQSTYWTRWVMGLISGIVLSQLIYDVFLANPENVSPSREIVPPAIGQPLLALFGGYSVDVVLGFLNRLIAMFDSFFSGPSAPARTPAAARPLDGTVDSRVVPSAEITNAGEAAATGPMPTRPPVG